MSQDFEEKLLRSFFALQWRDTIFPVICFCSFFGSVLSSPSGELTATWWGFDVFKITGEYLIFFTGSAPVIKLYLGLLTLIKQKNPYTKSTLNYPSLDFKTLPNNFSVRKNCEYCVGDDLESDYMLFFSHRSYSYSSVKWCTKRAQSENFWCSYF